MTTPRSPLRGRYLVRNRAWNAWLHVSDSVLETFTTDAHHDDLPLAPRRLLLAVGGHMGDAVLATSVLDPIRSMWPHVEIGVVTGSWNRPVFLDHPDVRWFHSADHWKLNRSASWSVRIANSAMSYRAATREIAEVRYDTAIDLYPYYPNSSQLLKRAGIPRRFGYASGGRGMLYTHALEWAPGLHVTGDHFRLVRELSGKPLDNASARYKLATAPKDVRASVDRRLRDVGESGGYVVLHMGSGMSRKRWPPSSWTEIARELSARGVVVLTGSGPRDAELTATLRAQVPGVADLCDKLTWNEFRDVLARARAVVTVDTVAAHLAAAEGSPTIVIMTGMDEPVRWQPLGDHVTVLTKRVPCSPCYRSRGCAAMSCITEVTPATVLSATAPFLARDVALHAARPS